MMGYTHWDTAIWLRISESTVFGDFELYRDFFEINPPFSLIFYAPTYALTALGAPVWLSTAPVSFLLIAASIYLIDKIDPKYNRFSLIYYLFFVSTQWLDFMQRESIIAILLLPSVLALVAHNTKGIPRFFAAGFAAIIIVMKPFYAFVFLGLFLLLWREKEKRSFYLSLVFGAFWIILWVAFLFGFFPQYLGAAMEARNYLAIGKEASTENLLVLIAFLVLLIASRRAWILIVALGLFLALVLQGKYFSYHQVPLLIFGGAVFLHELISHYKSEKYGLFIATSLGFLIAAILLTSNLLLHGFRHSNIQEQSNILEKSLQKNGCKTHAVFKITLPTFIFGDPDSRLLAPSADFYLRGGMAEFGAKLVVDNIKKTRPSCLVFTENNLEEVKSQIEPLGYVPADSTEKFRIFIYEPRSLQSNARP